MGTEIDYLGDYNLQACEHHLKFGNGTDLGGCRCVIDDEDCNITICFFNELL